MPSQKSPSGAMFPYYYKGGELCGLHLGSYFSDQAGVIAMMKAEAAFFTQQNKRIGMWIDFYETKLTRPVVEQFVEFVVQVHTRLTRLAIVGCSSYSRWKLNRLFKKTRNLSALPIKYFADPEEAKTWLVSERE